MNYEDLEEKYKSEFDPQAYPEALETIRSIYLFYQEELYSIFSSPSFHGRSLLDVGCGPTVHNLFPVTKKIDDIVVSDLLPQNRLAVEKWIQRAPDAIDWSFVSERSATIEGCKDVKSGAKEIEERVRRAIRKVVPCNVLDPQVLPDEHKESFDVVLTSLCLGSACLDEEMYHKAVRNVCGLVSRGGYLIVCGIWGTSGYSVKETTFPSLSASVDLTKESLAHSGFEIERFNSIETDDKYGRRQGYVILARQP